MIDRNMTAPFIAAVKIGRSTKANIRAKASGVKIGEAVEVHCFSRKWDSARCKRSDGEFVWLSFKNLERTGPVSDKVAAALATERKAWRAKTAEMLELCQPQWENAKAIGIDMAVENTMVGSWSSARVFLPKSQIKNGAAPRWLIEAKLEEVLERKCSNQMPRTHWVFHELLSRVGIFPGSAEKAFMYVSEQEG